MTRNLAGKRPAAVLLLAVAAAIAATVIAACSSASGASTSGKIVAVGAENEYADVIQQVGGKYVQASAITRPWTTCWIISTGQQKVYLSGIGSTDSHMIELAKLIHLSTVEIKGRSRGSVDQEKNPVYRSALHRGEPAGEYRR